MMGGPTMNLLIAVFLLGGILTLYGVPTATPLISTDLAERRMMMLAKRAGDAQ